MSNRFQAPSAEELAARGLNPDGTPMKKAAPKKAVTKKAKVEETVNPDETDSTYSGE